MMRVPYAIALLLFAVTPAIAQDPSELRSPRPEKSEPPDVVEPGVLQLETSVYAQRALGTYRSELHEVERATRNDLANGAWLVRLGVGDGLELRVEGSASRESIVVDSCTQAQRLDARVAGFSAPVVGVKLSLLDEEHDPASLSVSGSVSLEDDGGDLISSLSPGLRFAAARSLTEELGVVANLATAWDGTSLVPAAAYTLSLTGALSESIGVYAGLIGDVAFDAAATHSVDAGIGYTFSDSFSAEIFGAVGLTQAAPDFYGGIGVAIGVR